MPIMPIGNNNQEVNPQIEVVAEVGNVGNGGQQNNHFSPFADVGNANLQNNEGDMVYAYGDNDALVQQAYAYLYEVITGEPYNNANNNQ